MICAEYAAAAGEYLDATPICARTVAPQIGLRSTSVCADYLKQYVLAARRPPKLGGRWAILPADVEDGPRTPGRLRRAWHRDRHRAVTQAATTAFRQIITRFGRSRTWRGRIERRFTSPRARAAASTRRGAKSIHRAADQLARSTFDANPDRPYPDGNVGVSHELRGSVLRRVGPQRQEPVALTTWRTRGGPRWSNAGPIDGHPHYNVSTALSVVNVDSNDPNLTRA